MCVNIPFRHKLTQAFSSEGAGHVLSPGWPQRWRGFSLFFILMVAGALPGFHCQKMKNNPGLLVPDVVALFLHHLWNNGARSVNKDHGFFFQLQIKLEFSNLTATIGYFLIYVFNKTLFPPLPTWSEHQEMIRTCLDLSELPVSLQNPTPEVQAWSGSPPENSLSLLVMFPQVTHKKNRGNGW